MRSIATELGLGREDGSFQVYSGSHRGRASWLQVVIEDRGLTLLWVGYMDASPAIILTSRARRPRVQVRLLIEAPAEVGKLELRWAFGVPGSSSNYRTAPPAES